MFAVREVNPIHMPNHVKARRPPTVVNAADRPVARATKNCSLALICWVPGIPIVLVQVVDGAATFVVCVGNLLDDITLGDEITTVVV